MRLHRYPEAGKHSDHSRLFNEERNTYSSPHWTNMELDKRDNDRIAERANTSELFSELSKLIPREESEASKRRRSSAHAEGLGKLPGYLPSVSSVLLFNSSENPYKDYSSFDNLVSAITRERDVIADEELFAAPSTLIEGADLPSFDNPMEALKYNPQIEELPSLDLPENLPLGQLADISFLSSSVEGSIAPSMANLSDLPMDLSNLPPIAPPSKKQPNQAQHSNIGSSIGSNIGSLPDISGPPSSMAQSQSAAPPPPVAAPPSSMPPPPTMASAAVPPPPNVPTPPLSAAAPPPPKLNPSPAPPTASSGGGGRSALLNAIRAGKKLKKGRKANKARGGGKKKEVPPPMDMMGQLRARLARHRKAIGGKNTEIKKPAFAVDVPSPVVPRRPPPRRGPLSGATSPKSPQTSPIKSFKPPTPPPESDDDDDGWESD